MGFIYAHAISKRKDTTMQQYKKVNENDAKIWQCKESKCYLRKWRNEALQNYDNSTCYKAKAICGTFKL
jgi:hypothetical protein